MKRHLSVYFLLAITIVLMISGLAYASATTPHDSYIEILGDKNKNHGGETVLTAYSTDNTTTGACDANYRIYLRWNLDSVNGKASVSGSNQTKLTLNANATIGITPNDTLNLYEVPPTVPKTNTWTESTITGNNAPALGNLIQSIPAPTSAGLVTFSNQKLADWINENSSYTGDGDTTAGEDIVSFAIQIEGCNNTSVIRFDSKDPASSGLAPMGIAPALSLYDPNSVILKTSSAESSSTNWPVMAGLAALLVLVVAGLGFGVRRFNS